MGSHQIPVRRKSAHALLATAALLKAEVDTRLMAAVGFPLADNEALANLRDAGGPLRMGEIADRVTLSRGGTTKLIDRLEESGYVTREPDPSDRRATTVTITAEGLAVLERSRPIIIAALDELWTRHIDDAAAAEVLRIVSEVRRANWCP